MLAAGVRVAGEEMSRSQYSWTRRELKTRYSSWLMSLIRTWGLFLRL